MALLARWPTLIVGAGLLLFGLTRPVDRSGDTVWLICLWAAAPLLLIAVRSSVSLPPRSLARSVLSLGQVISVAFILLSLQLLRQQVIQANALATKVYTNEATGEVTSNVRQVLNDMRTVRGRIFDRNEALLVASEVREGGLIHRLYPLADSYDPAAFSNIVGFYSARFGLAGIESTYNDYLSGQRGLPSERLTNSLYGRAQVGSDLHLTLNAQLQAEVSAIMAGRTGSAVVLDPRTGEVLALVSVPGFDPRGLTFDPAAESWADANEAIGEYWRILNADDSGQPLLNRASQGLYPPGSTYKTVTAVGVLEDPRVGRPDDITCPNTYDAGDPNAPPVVNAVADLAGLTGNPSNLERVYAYSCNTAFAQYAVRLGAELFTRNSANFGVYRPEIASEQTPDFEDLTSNVSRLSVNAGALDNPRLLADAGYGQAELLVTPLQMALVAAAIANDGVMMKPYLVTHITAPDGREISRRQPQVLRRAMSAETAAAMRRNMQAVVAYGFGQAAAVPGYNVGGKSGTAEHVPGARPHAWYISIAPLEEPRYAVAVMLESGGEGSSVGAELAGQVMGTALRLGAAQ